MALPDDVISPVETGDAYLHFYQTTSRDFDRSIPPQKKIKHPMRLDEMGLVRKGNRSSVKFYVAQDDLMRHCASYDGSPVTAITLILAEAIRSVHADSDRDVVIGIPVNLRPAMGIKDTICNTYSKIYIRYSDKIWKKDLEMQGTMCRGTVLRYSDRDLLKKQTYDYCRKLNLVKYLPLTYLKQLVARGVVKEMTESETADVTYVGREQYGEMEEYISSMYGDVDSYGLGILTIIVAFGDKFYISVGQDWEEKVYVDAFFRILTERHIPYHVEYDGEKKVSHLCI